MRILLTGATGFVGSNLAAVFAAHGAEVIAPSHAELELTDGSATRAAIADAAPDAVVHAAIRNDLGAGEAELRDAYVGATGHVVDGARDAGARVVLVSTDWVFDGGPADEDAPPAPVNAYGRLKAECEELVLARAERGTVARIAGVQGVHRARPAAPRAQDHGFGYFVLSLAEALERGERFTVWDGDGVNQCATPTLAADAGELIWRALERDLGGVLHCVGGEHAERVAFARRAAAAFGHDPELVASGPAPPSPEPVPRDTRLDARATAARLGVELPGLDDQLGRLRAEVAA